MKISALCLMAALSALALFQAGCAHSPADSSASDRRIASYQEKNNLLCSIRKPDGTLFNEFGPSERSQVRELCQHDSESNSECSGAIYCKRLVDPKGQEPVRCSMTGVTGTAAGGETIAGSGANTEEAQDATHWSCIQHHSYDDCGAGKTSCNR